LPIIRERLVSQYKREKQERLNAPQIDFVQERAEENKTFFKLRPKEENEVSKEVVKTAEKTAEKEMPQEQEEHVYKAFKR